MGNYLLNLAFNLSAFMVCFTGLFYTLIEERTHKLQSRLYLGLIFIVAINASTNMITAIRGIADAVPGGPVQQVCTFIYFLTHSALCPLFFFYCATVSGTIYTPNKSKKIALSIPFIITEIFVFINPISKIVWFYNEEGYHRNKGEALIYLAAVFYFAFSILVLFRTWRALTLKRRAALIFFCFMVCGGVLVQLLFKDFKIEIFSESLGLIGLLLAVENEDDRMDTITGFYNRRALQLDIEASLISKREMNLIIIRIMNSDIILKMTGSSNMGIMSEMISGYLNSVAPRRNIYMVSPGTFVVTVYDKPADELTKDISNRFEETWTFKETQIPLQTVLMVAGTHDRITGVAEAIYMIDSPLPEDNDKKILSGSDLDYLIRQIAVEGAVTRGLSEDSFEVYYQPTYTIGRMLQGAEALLRMHDKELGNLFPDEFIPIAERLGLIDDIDDFVLVEVCKFIKSGTPRKMGMKYININLSVLQCMRSGFVEHINEIVEAMDVPKQFINFEITESIAANDYKALANVVSELKKDGFLFSMDDYGTGYSNINAIAALDFDIIKIDKSVLWDAEKSDLGRIILENSVRMIRQIKKQIQVEGVETPEQVRMLEKLEVDYLQGYYFSKPLPVKELIKLLG